MPFPSRAFLATAVFFALAMQPAAAMPIFAQRYQMKCTACHTVLPELNTFGDYFRDHGYRLPLVKHKTTIAAIRYQLEWDETPQPPARRFLPGGIVLSNAEAGQISAFLHYNLGAQGGPAGAYLAFLSRYDAHTQTTYRAGLFELPLIHSPGQRLDDLAPYGYEQTHVGLNDLTLAQPRWGIEAERTAGVTRFAATVALGEFKGAAYGGAPIDTGITSHAGQPEIGGFVRSAVTPWLTASGDALIGSRALAQTGRPLFKDSYRRSALGLDLHADRWSVLAQQWWGVDRNDDGFGDSAGSSGGFVRLRYAMGEHAYIGTRYDTAAAPSAVRDYVIYGAVVIGGRVRLLVENKKVQFGKSSLEGALTIAVPFFAKD